MPPRDDSAVFKEILLPTTVGIRMTCQNFYRVEQTLTLDSEERRAGSVRRGPYFARIQTDLG